MTTARSRRLATALAVAGLLSLSACGTGVDAQTNAVYQPGVGANVRTGAVQLYNTVLVDNGDDTYTLSAGVLNTTDSAVRLSSYSVRPLDGGAAVTGKPQVDFTVADERLETIGFDGEVVVDSTDLSPGRYAAITLTFDDGDDVTIQAPVVARTAEYSSVASKPGTPDNQGEQAEKDAQEAEDVS